MVFKREVTAVNRVELDLRHVGGRLHAGAREKRVVDAGGDHHLTLVRLEELPRIGDRLIMRLRVRTVLCTPERILRLLQAFLQSQRRIDNAPVQQR